MGRKGEPYWEAHRTSGLLAVRWQCYCWAQYGRDNGWKRRLFLVPRPLSHLMMAGWVCAVVLTPSSMYSWYFEQAAVWPLIWERPTWIESKDPYQTQCQDRLVCIYLQSPHCLPWAWQLSKSYHEPQTKIQLLSALSPDAPGYHIPCKTPQMTEWQPRAQQLSSSDPTQPDIQHKLASVYVSTPANSCGRT